MSGKNPQNPARVLGLELYERRPRGDVKTGWIAVSYDFDDGGYWIQFEHRTFQPWDMRLAALEIIIDLVNGNEYLREK